MSEQQQQQQHHSSSESEKRADLVSICSEEAETLTEVDALINEDFDLYEAERLLLKLRSVTPCTHLVHVEIAIRLWKMYDAFSYDRSMREARDEIMDQTMQLLPKDVKHPLYSITQTVTEGRLEIHVSRDFNYGHCCMERYLEQALTHCPGDVYCRVDGWGFGTDLLCYKWESPFLVGSQEIDNNCHDYEEHPDDVRVRYRVLGDPNMRKLKVRFYLDAIGQLPRPPPDVYDRRQKQKAVMFGMAAICRGRGRLRMIS